MLLTNDKETFICIPNMFFTDGKEKASSEELYLYFNLCLYEAKWYSCKVFTSVNLIARQIKLRENDHQNKNQIKKVLFSLKEKNLLQDIEVETNSKGSISSDSPIEISLYPIDRWTKSKEILVKGFEKINLSHFEKVNNSKTNERADEFMVICYILKKKQPISFDEWSRVLDVCGKTASSIISRMEKRGTITVSHGRYYITEQNKVKQEINNYRVNDPNINLEQSNNINSIPNNLSASVTHNWFNTNKLTRDDFILYLTTDDTKLKETADKKINRISKTEQGKFMMEKLKAEAEDKIRENQVKEKLHKDKEERDKLISWIQECPTNIIKDQKGNIFSLNLSKLEGLNLKDKVLSVEKVDNLDELGHKKVSRIEVLEEEIIDILYGFKPKDGIVKINASIRESLFSDFKELILANKKFVQEHKQIINERRERVLAQHNKERLYNEDWEGDIYFYDGSVETNQSKDERILKEKSRLKDEVLLEHNVIIQNEKRKGMESILE